MVFYYEKKLMVDALFFDDFKALETAASLLLKCMFESNKINNYTCTEFKIDFAPEVKGSKKLLRIQWGLKKPKGD